MSSADASRYIPPSQAGAYVSRVGDGDGEGISTFEKYAQFWGQPAAVLPRFNPHGNPVADIAMPQAYENKSGFVEDIITGLLNKAPHIETTRLAPFWDTDRIEWDWNETHFDTGHVGGVPHHGMPRMLTSEQEHYHFKSIRRGIAMMLEHDFLSTPEGRLHYANQLISMAQSVLETACHDVMYTLYAHSHADYVRNATTYGKSIEELIRHRANNFAAMNKSADGLATVLEDTIDLVKANGDIQPDTIIMPTRSSMFITLTNSTERTTLFKSLFSGVAISRNVEQARWSYAGIPVYEIQRYQMDRNNTLDLSVQTVSFGEFYWLKNPLKDHPRHTDKYNSNLCNIKIYSARKDDYQVITLRQAYRHAGRFNFDPAADNAAFKIDRTHYELIYGGNDDLAQVQRKHQRYFNGRAARDPAVYNNRAANAPKIIHQLGDIEPEYLHDSDCADAVEALYAEIASGYNKVNGNDILREFRDGLTAIGQIEAENAYDLQERVESNPEGSTYATALENPSFRNAFTAIVDRALAAFGTSVFANPRWSKASSDLSELDKRRATVFYSLVLPPRANVYVRVRDGPNGASSATTTSESRATSSEDDSSIEPRLAGTPSRTGRSTIQGSIEEMSRKQYTDLSREANNAFRNAYGVTKAEYDAARLPSFEDTQDFMKDKVGAPLIGLANNVSSTYDGIARPQAQWVLALPQGKDSDSILRALTYVLRFYSQKAGKEATETDRHVSGSAYLKHVQDLYEQGNASSAQQFLNRIITVSGQLSSNPSEAVKKDATDIANEIYSLRRGLSGGTRSIKNPASDMRSDFVHAYQKLALSVAAQSAANFSIGSRMSAGASGGQWRRTNYHFSPQQLRELARQQDQGRSFNIAPPQDFFVSASPVAERWTSQEYEAAKRSHRPANHLKHTIAPQFRNVTLTATDALSSVMSLGDHHMYRMFKDGNRYNRLNTSGTKRSLVGASMAVDIAGNRGLKGPIEYINPKTKRQLSDDEIKSLYDKNVTENFASRWAEAESSNNPIKTLLIRLYLGCRYVGKTFDNFEKNNVPIPFDFLIVRLEITLEMSSGLVLKAGFDTARTAVNKMNLQGADNAVTKFTYLGLTYYSKCVIIRAKRIARLNHIFCRRYLSGLDTTFYENPTQFENPRGGRLQTSNNTPQKRSIMVFMLPYRTDPTHEYGDIMDVRGFWDNKHYGMSLGGERNHLHYAGALYYTLYYKFDSYANGHHSMPVNNTEAYFHNTARKTRNTVMIQGHQISYDADTLKFDRPTVGRGHLGKWARTGLLDAMNLNGQKSFPQDPRSGSLRSMAVNL